ncbi:MAG: hypothetical protein NVSMB9_04110 [Isosphaeraceae bacterium]
MSVVTRPRRLNETLTPSFSTPMAAVPSVGSEFEPPEQAVCPREALETRSGRQAEAPDAGVGRASYLEHEFTHGRSQS